MIPQNFLIRIYAQEKVSCNGVCKQTYFDGAWGLGGVDYASPNYFDQILENDFENYEQNMNNLTSFSFFTSN